MSFCEENAWSHSWLTGCTTSSIMIINIMLGHFHSFWNLKFLSPHEIKRFVVTVVAVVVRKVF